MNIGTNIRKVRDLKGFSQEFMANRLTISQRQYSRIENNETELTLSKLETISDVLEVSIEQLLGFDDQHIFNNNNQQGGNAASVLIQSFSEKEREQYEKRICHLEGEILFLRNQLESK